jgi:tetraacyldisaccharide-1-P 4'-kinase
MLTPAEVSAVALAALPHPADLDAVLAQMGLDVPYLFADVHAEYATIARANGRTPTHQVPFAKALYARDDVVRVRPYAKVGDRRRQVRGVVRTLAPGVVPDYVSARRG